MFQNPYTLMFGKSPSQSINRLAQTDQIISSFSAEVPATQIYMITGVRGSGKTVFMTELSKYFHKKKNWVTVDLNPAADLLQGLAARLYNKQTLTRMFEQAKIDLSFLGIGLQISGARPVTDLETAVIRMLEQIKKAGQKLLITIDEASNTDFMKVFASAFQIFVRHNLPVFLLMTGLYENIRELQNEKILTFLYRAPRIELAPLNIGSIAENYRGSFQLSAESSLEMAKLTKGYPFAFQALGYYTWENNGDYKASVPLCRQTLEEYVYEKLWAELSATDRRVCSAISETPSGRIKEVREKLQMDSNEFSPYRDRLIRRGLVVGDIRGYIRFALPFFADFVQTTAV